MFYYILKVIKELDAESIIILSIITQDYYSYKTNI